MPQYRNEQGLTPKQVESIEIVASAATIRQGVLKVVEAGILNDTNYWYLTWWREPAYRTAVNERRKEIYGASREQAQTFMEAFKLDVVASTVAGALKAGPQQPAFQRLFYEVLGQLSGAPLVSKQVFNVTIGDAGHLQIPERFRQHMESRKEMLRLLRAPAGNEVAVQQHVAGNGNGNGDGHD